MCLAHRENANERHNAFSLLERQFSVLDAAYLLLLRGPKSQLSTDPDFLKSCDVRSSVQGGQPVAGTAFAESARRNRYRHARHSRPERKGCRRLAFSPRLGRVLQLSRSIASRPAEPTRTHIGSFCSTSSIQLLSSPSRNPNTSSIAVLMSRSFPCCACWARWAEALRRKKVSSIM